MIDLNSVIRMTSVANHKTLIHYNPSDIGIIEKHQSDIKKIAIYTPEFVADCDCPKGNIYLENIDFD